MGAEIHYTGSITFDTPVPMTAIGGELRTLERLEIQDDLYTLTYSGPEDSRALTGLEADDYNDWASTRAWGMALCALSDIARHHDRTLQAEATWECDPGPYRGTLIVDAGNLFHDVPDDQDPDIHRARRCTCYPGEGDPVFAVDAITDDPRVRITTQPAGPFTDHVVTCDDHGETHRATSHTMAVCRREQHLMDQHTASPLLLGTEPALNGLPPEVVLHIKQAAAQLVRTRTHPRPLRSRAEARRHTAQAHALLNGDLTSALLHALVEQAASALDPSPR